MQDTTPEKISLDDEENVIEDKDGELSNEDQDLIILPKRTPSRLKSLLYLYSCPTLTVLIVIGGLVLLNLSYVEQDQKDYNESLYARDVLKNIWIVGTIVAFYDRKRRDLIRNSWIRLYKRYNVDFRFVVCRPSEEYGPVLQAENNTYGDIIVLKDLEENWHNAATIKPMEFFKYLRNSQPYTFVSRIDGDTFLNVPAFWDEFIVPNLNDPRRLIIARDMYPVGPPFPFPGGQFYTISWDLVCLLLRLHEKNPITNENDDMIIGRLMFNSKEKFKIIDLFCYKAFDYDPQITDINQWQHMVTKDSINPHKMKTDESFLEVASMFDENGVNLTAVQEVYNRYDHNKTYSGMRGCWENITVREYPQK